MSPSKFLQDQGGIEGIIQEAARGVYSRGEKWGVARALRGAVQGLQSAGNTSSMLASAPRWSLDAGGMVIDDSAKLTARVNALEQRNKTLAKLLEKSMEDLWVQQREFTKDKAEAAADALSLAIAKVQFVQVYLENPTMPLPTEDQVKESDDSVKALENKAITEVGPPTERPVSQPDGQSSPMRKPIVKEIRRKSKAAGQASASQTPVGSPSKKQESLSTPTESIPSINISKDSSAPELPSQIRPALAQSSFSWILGEDQRKSDFGAATPFSSERERFRGKAGFLFGDQKTEDPKPNSTTSKGRHSAEEEVEEETINLGTMKAAEKPPEL